MALSAAIEYYQLSMAGRLPEASDVRRTIDGLASEWVWDTSSLRHVWTIDRDVAEVMRAGRDVHPDHISVSAMAALRVAP